MVKAISMDLREHILGRYYRVYLVERWRVILWCRRENGHPFKKMIC